MDRVRLYRNEFFKRAYKRKRRFVDTFDSCEQTLIRFYKHIYKMCLLV